MKKGCFLSLITILTLVTMAGIYLFRNNKDFLKKFGKEKLLSFVTNSMDDKLNKLQNNPYKDSLKVLLQKEIKYVKENNFDDAMRKFGYVMDRVKDYSLDGKIDSTEYVNLKIMVMENEKSKKN